MGDGRALQCGTSHFLGQNFARAFEIRFLDEKNEMVHPWQTSWGVSTRLLGAMIMTHGDDQGLRLPPAVASTQVVVVPIWRKADEGEQVLNTARSILLALENAGIRGETRRARRRDPRLQVQRLGDARGAGTGGDWSARRRLGRGRPRTPRHSGTVGKNESCRSAKWRRARPFYSMRSRRTCWSRRVRRRPPIRIWWTATTSCSRTDEGRRRWRFRRHLLVRESGVRDQDSRGNASDVPCDSAQPIASAGQLRRVRGGGGGASVVREGVLKRGRLGELMRS